MFRRLREKIFGEGEKNFGEEKVFLVRKREFFFFLLAGPGGRSQN